jgi:hypothetical protein
MTAPIRFSIATLPGLRFEAVPLTSPPRPGAIVFLYGERLLAAVAEYEGGGVWNIVHERFPGLEPTHWVRTLPSGDEIAS